MTNIQIQNTNTSTDTKQKWICVDNTLHCVE